MTKPDHTTYMVGQWAVEVANRAGWTAIDFDGQRNLIQMLGNMGYSEVHLRPLVRTGPTLDEFRKLMARLPGFAERKRSYESQAPESDRSVWEALSRGERHEVAEWCWSLADENHGNTFLHRMAKLVERPDRGRLTTNALVALANTSRFLAQPVPDCLRWIEPAQPKRQWVDQERSAR